jgi:Ca-activated chloride channel family protein
MKRNHSKSLFLFLVLLQCIASIGFAQIKTSTAVKTRILFMMDASGSMTNNWSTSNRFKISKTVIAAMADSLQKNPNVEMGLRVFGSMSPLSVHDCKDSRIETPIRPNNANNIKLKLNTLNAKGITPIAYALEQCAYDFVGSNEKCRNIVILITDGIESCEGNACEVSKRLQQKGIILQPFIIGLGLSAEAAATFDCIGRYDDAQDEIGFRKALKSTMNFILNNTTVQLNLLDEKGKATETNVPVTFYDNVVDVQRYHFIHTLNARGNADTLQIDPINNYNIVVHTTPPIEKKNVSIATNQHNIITIPAAQGELLVTTDGLSTYKELACVITKANSEETIDVLTINEKKKYLTGLYDIEILTLPRISIQSTRIAQSELTTIKIPAPGLVTILNTNAVPVLGSIFKEKGQSLDWVCDINGNSTTETITLQPGNYRLVYKNKGSKRAMTTRDERFKISSGSSANIRF